MWKLFVGLSLVLLLCLPARAQMGDIPGVISSQIEAFQMDDLDRAFSHASPMIRGMFKNPQNFGMMVERGYPMVWRPANVRFGLLKSVDGRNVQIVFLTDQLGRVFEASYEMIETQDGWQINGVTLKEVGLGA